jgi:hypothetical protein
MCSALELEHDKYRMEMDDPEVWAFRMALDVLQDRNNHIRGEWNITVPCLPPIFENLIAAHVIHMLKRSTLVKALVTLAFQRYSLSNAESVI